MRLRPATAADVSRLADLVQAAYGHYVVRLGLPPRPVTDDSADVVRDFRVTVAEQEGEIVGLIVLGVGEEGFVVANVAVDPSYQGYGVGRALLEHAVRADRLRRVRPSPDRRGPPRLPAQAARLNGARFIGHPESQFLTLSIGGSRVRLGGEFKTPTDQKGSAT